MRPMPTDSALSAGSRASQSEASRGRGDTRLRGDGELIIFDYAQIIVGFVMCVTDFMVEWGDTHYIGSTLSPNEF